MVGQVREVESHNRYKGELDADISSEPPFPDRSLALASIAPVQLGGHFCVASHYTEFRQNIRRSASAWSDTTSGSEESTTHPERLASGFALLCGGERRMDV